ncbi:MAG TPA: response regulator [Phycisphaerales bacterium]|nr:response regulator [Phycisphaerales bacterium]
MSQPKPKLLIVGGPGVPAEELSRCLGGEFDVRVEQPDAAAGRLHDESFEAVVAGASEFPEMRDHPAALLLNTIGEGVCLVDVEARELWANARYKGLPAAILERVRRCYQQAASELSSPGRVLGGELPPASKFDLSDPREQVAYEVFVHPTPEAGPAPSGDGAPVRRLAVVVRDVSTERRLAQRMSAIDRAGAELVGLEAEAVRKNNSAERLKALETRIVRIAHELLSFDHFVIRLIDERSKRLEPVISAGLPREAIDLELFAEEEGNGISGYVAATGRSVICADAQTDERFMPGLGEARSSLTVPLRLHDKVIGIMNVESERPSAFNEEDRQFGEIFARYIAISLHMLDLLVVERSTTNLSVSGRVEGELRDCLEDILSEAEWLTGAASRDPETARHIARIKADVESIRARVRNMAAGPQTLLGVERALADRTEDPILKGKRVLVADDESKIRRIIRDVLRSRGCLVIASESGADAIEKLAGVKPDERFDIIISDIKMPDRNGYQVFAAAREAIPGVPVILMTGFGYDPHHSIVRASQEGLQSVLFKPFQIERLIEEIRKALAPK